MKARSLQDLAALKKTMADQRAQAEAERQRRIEGDLPHKLGDWPFEIGMWVGKGATPNKLGGPNDPDQKSTYNVLNRWKKKGNDRPIPIETCPRNAVCHK